jgi:hypothetical protein
MLVAMQVAGEVLVIVPSIALSAGARHAAVTLIVHSVLAAKVFVRLLSLHCFFGRPSFSLPLLCAGIICDSIDESESCGAFNSTCVYCPTGFGCPATLPGSCINPNRLAVVFLQVILFKRLNVCGCCDAGRGRCFPVCRMHECLHPGDARVLPGVSRSRMSQQVHHGAECMLDPVPLVAGMGSDFSGRLWRCSKVHPLKLPSFQSS